MIIYILFFVKRSHKIFYNKKRTAETTALLNELLLFFQRARNACRAAHYAENCK